MSVRNGLAALVLAAAGAAPAPAWAWGVPGCTNLPEYNRALGALQGMTSACDMSVEEARRVVAAHDGVAPGPRSPPRSRRRRGSRRGTAGRGRTGARGRGIIAEPAGAQVSSPGAPGGSARARAQSRSRCACRARCSAT